MTDAAPKPVESAPVDSTVKYLEQKLSAAQNEIQQLRALLMVYREHSLALTELTSAVFPAQSSEPEKKED